MRKFVTVKEAFEKLIDVLDDKNIIDGEEFWEDLLKRKE